MDNLQIIYYNLITEHFKKKEVINKMIDLPQMTKDIWRSQLHKQYCHNLRMKTIKKFYAIMGDMNWRLELINDFCKGFDIKLHQPHLNKIKIDDYLINVNLYKMVYEKLNNYFHNNCNYYEKKYIRIFEDDNYEKLRDKSCNLLYKYNCYLLNNYKCLYPTKFLTDTKNLLNNHQKIQKLYKILFNEPPPKWNLFN